MFIKISSLYDFISLITPLSTLYIIYSLDPQLIFGSSLCIFSHYLLKMLTTGSKFTMFKRPDGATDCSLFNTGGLVDHKSGFPSGHVASISFLMNLLWLHTIKDNGISTIENLYTYVGYNIPVALVAYARVMKGCHNILQVTFGYMLGYAIASLMLSYDDNFVQITEYIRTFSVS